MSGIIRVRAQLKREIEDKYGVFGTERIHILIRKGMLAEDLMHKSLNYIVFLMKFFQKHARVIAPLISAEERDEFKEIAEFLKSMEGDRYGV